MNFIVQVDPDIQAMNEHGLRQYIMKQRQWVRNAAREEGNKSCWVPYLVICSQFLPRAERAPFLQAIMAMPKELFLSNCGSWHDFAVSQGTAVDEVIHDLNNPE